MFERIKFYVLLLLASFTSACCSASDEVETVTADTQNLATGSYSYTTEQIYTYRGSNRIYGELYTPTTDAEKLPAIIISHGLNNTGSFFCNYARDFASAGFIVYLFDFCGGGNGSRSDGLSTDMSVFTEKEDLNAVLDKTLTLDRVDKSRVFLFGCSQGGMVSSLAAVERQADIAGLMLMYPALYIPSHMRSAFPRYEDIPDSYRIQSNFTVGRAYVESVYNFDIWSYIQGFKKDVLIVSGEKSGVPDAAAARQATENFPSATLHLIPGAGHVFYGNHYTQSVEYTLEWLNSRMSSSTSVKSMAMAKSWMNKSRVFDLSGKAVGSTSEIVSLKPGMYVLASGTGKSESSKFIVR